MVAVFASERTNEEKRAQDSFHRASSPGLAHRITVALWTDILFAKLYETHKAAFIWRSK